MGEREQPLTGGHVVEQRALRVGAEFGDHATRNQRRRRDRLGGQPAADLGHHNHDLDRAGFLGIEAQAQDADLGQLPPHVAAPAESRIERCVDDLIPTLGVVAAGQHVARGVGQQLLLFGQVKVHGSPYSPRIVEAMMVRCTSLVPP